MSDPERQTSDERLEALFHKLDTRNEGHLDLDGFQRGLKRINHPLKHADGLIADILHAVDTSNDGLIQFSEFKAFFQGAERELLRIFRSVDTNHNGHIDKTELKAALNRAGIVVDPPERLEDFFAMIDRNNDGEISFEEWRDFLMFIPQEASLKTIYSYYLATVNVNPEGDVNLSDELNLQGLGYFLAGGLAGAISRTATAPFDRLKVYLIAQTKSLPKDVAAAAAQAQPVVAAQRVVGPFKHAVSELWRAGGVRSFFAGNGLNVIKVLPESAIKFGSFEAAKRTLARLEGVEDTAHISQVSRFIAGGVGGVVSQFAIYPIDTLKFRVQCNMVEKGLHGNKLIVDTLRKSWKSGGITSFYRGLPLALCGIFPYSAIDMGTYEFAKRTYIAGQAKRLGCKEADVRMPQWMTLGIGAASGCVGATMVYPINLLRTRLQAQGTIQHPQTYTGMVDVTMRTLNTEGFLGLWRGLTPNLMKVLPAVSISYLVYENSKAVMGLK
ncbi:mitochondrial carrier [Ascodesmis nigricans]|uniref:Mitochondrial thiamine pyrophosphate carrier 1 n=1 Tax=Ascodesmis nigricans TaxID=341454 RepID=A0A4V3SHS9_9PEZI|nr:mitochondrial carrier [Ascodesmis nigricans]